MVLNVVLLLLALFINGLLYYISELNFVWIVLFVVLVPITFILLFGVEIVILFVWSLFFNKKKEVKHPNKFYLWLVYQVNHQVVFLSNTKVDVSNLDLIPNDSRYVIVYNHLSNFDPMVIMNELSRDDIVCITKRGNENIPIAGSFIHKAGFIPIDRDNTISCAHSVVKACRFLKDNCCSIAVAPEGTRNKKKEDVLLPFHNGVFKIAIKTKLPIVVSVVENTELIHKNFPFKRTNVKFRVIKVIDYIDYRDKSCEEIKEYVYSIMKKSLEVK